MMLPAHIVAALRKSELAHKFSHGHLMVLSGGVGRGGAARLAARAGLRIGAGVVTVACPPAALQENAARLDAIMLRPVRNAKDFVTLLQDDRINALCIGPALGLGAREADLVGAALAARRPTVLDADALTLLSHSSDLRAALHPNCILTPHLGEFMRLFPDMKQEQANGLEHVRHAARHMQCVIVLKGALTVIAAPEMTATSNATGADAVPWLATAGSGDVLAGIIAGLLARSFAPFDAAHAGALVHQAAARLFGPGLIAEDLPDLIPQVLREAGA